MGGRLFAPATFFLDLPVTSAAPQTAISQAKGLPGREEDKHKDEEEEEEHKDKAEEDHDKV